MTSPTQTYRGVFPVAPTVFDASGALDLDGQRRAIDFMIDAGSEGLCILANFSEQFVLTDDERETVMHAVLEHVAGRVPVIVTTTHFATQVCAERSRRAQAARSFAVWTPFGCACRRTASFLATPRTLARTTSYRWIRSRHSALR